MAIPQRVKARFPNASYRGQTVANRVAQQADAAWNFALRMEWSPGTRGPAESSDATKKSRMSTCSPRKTTPLLGERFGTRKLLSAGLAPRSP
jgi:hypothetical protein